MTAMPDPIAVALRVADALETLGLRYTVGGSLASSMSGEPRSTLDVDMVVALQEADIAPLVAAVGTTFYVSEEALHREPDSSRDVAGNGTTSIAFLTDPWGTYIELTEGLAP